MTIAKEILSENKSLDVGALYNIAKRQLKLSRKGLLDIIKILLNNKFLVEGSKFTRETVLSNQDRKHIYFFIKQSLGVHFSLIKKHFFSEKEDSVGSSGQLSWHLGLLLKFDYIKKVKFKKYLIILPIELEPEVGIYYFLLRDENNNAIVKLLIEQETVKKSDIYKNLKGSRETIYYHIDSLINDKIIVEEPGANNNIYINPDKKDIIIEVLKNTQYENRKKQK